MRGQIKMGVGFVKRKDETTTADPLVNPLAPNRILIGSRYLIVGRGYK